MSEPTSSMADLRQPGDVRARIVAAAAELIAVGGRDAATTRAVAVAAGVQAPTIYRLFGDKRGLLDAVVQHGLANYTDGRTGREPDPDPVEELRYGWDMHVEFGLSHPGLFAIMAGDPHPMTLSPSAADAVGLLQRRIRNIALAGRLRVSEARAIALVHSVGTGVILALLGQPDDRRDPGLADAAREAVISAITGETEGPTGKAPNTMAAALRASLDGTTVLSAGERHLLSELLDRIANGS